MLARITLSPMYFLDSLLPACLPQFRPLCLPTSSCSSCLRLLPVGPACLLLLLSLVRFVTKSSALHFGGHLCALKIIGITCCSRFAPSVHTVFKLKLKTAFRSLLLLRIRTICHNCPSVIFPTFYTGILRSGMLENKKGHQ